MPPALSIAFRVALAACVIASSAWACRLAWISYVSETTALEVPALLEEGEYDKAKERLLAAIALTPGNATLHRLLGRTYSNISVFRDDADARRRAVRSLERAAKLDPLSGDNHFELAFAYLASRQNKRGEMAFQKALERDPYNTEYLFRLGFYYETQGRRDDAIRLYEACLNVKQDGFVERALARVRQLP